MFNSFPHNSVICKQILKQLLPSAQPLFISFITSYDTSTISKSQTASSNILTSTFRIFKQEVNYLDFKQMETLIDDILCHINQAEITGFSLPYSKTYTTNTYNHTNSFQNTTNNQFFFISSIYSKAKHLE